MNTEKIIDQIRKLRRLAEAAGTEGEAAAAAAAMQRLLLKHNLDLSEIDMSEGSEDRDEAVDHETVKVQTKQNDWRWRYDLLRAIATYNFCRFIQTEVFDEAETKRRRDKAVREGKADEWNVHWKVGGAYRHAALIVGQPHNREVVRFLYDLLTQTLERLGKGYSLRVEREEGEDIGGGRRAYQFSPRRAFYYGAVEVLAQRLAREWGAFQTQERKVFDPSLGSSVSSVVKNDKAIAVIAGNMAKIEAYVKAKFTLTRGRNTGAEARGAHPTNSYSAYEAGRAAGRSIPLQRGLSGGGAAPIKSLGEGKR